MTWHWLLDMTIDQSKHLVHVGARALLHHRQHRRFGALEVLTELKRKKNNFLWMLTKIRS